MILLWHSLEIGGGPESLGMDSEQGRMADLVIGVYSWAEAKLVAECSMELQENAEALCQNARLS